MHKTVFTSYATVPVSSIYTNNYQIINQKDLSMTFPYRGFEHKYTIFCTCIVIHFRLKSPIDGLSLEGVDNVKVSAGTDYLGQHRLIRWTQLFILQVKKILPKLQLKTAESLSVQNFL